MVSFKLFAGTNVGLRENNEDNFTVCPDLNKNEWIVPADNQQVIQLGSRGCVMVVADGMGGQNAGEVASAIAIDTVQEMFSPNQMSADVFDKSDAIKSFLKKVVVECDVRIKKRAEEDPSTEGMGSTIIIAWLIGCKLYIAWLGDSRAYSFIKNKGIARLSKDHSYVQQLVDAGVITDEETINHPNSNIITRSLGDTSQKAKADVVEYDIEDDQIVLLCSDGLCGVCKDEEIGGIIEEECSDLQRCKKRLTAAALAAGGSDNITISLLHIIKDNTQSPLQEDKPQKQKKIGLLKILASALGLCLLVALLYAGNSIIKPKEEVNKSVKISLDNDTFSSTGKTHFHIEVIKEKPFFHTQVIDDSINLVYDKKLIDVNREDSTISVGKRAFLTGDTTIYIKVICHKDSCLTDSVPLHIKKSYEGTPQSGGESGNVPKADNTSATPPNDSIPSSERGYDITPAGGPDSIGITPVEEQ